MGELDEDGETEVVALPGGAYDVDGIAPLEEIEDTLKIAFHAHNTRTVAGFIMERLGRMPRVGDHISEGGYTFYIMEVHGPRLRRVRIQREAGAPHGTAAAAGVPAHAPATPAAASPKDKP
ncbi:MAG: hypothetical protein EOO38_32345 [Cytophagaceae bacterium]|nr:MAG: hypothetical protein EOO38_32345 [Cytophagaceae bacterium]